MVRLAVPSEALGLRQDPDTGHVFVRHRPNLASGGQASGIELGTFLAQGGMGPEKQVLLRLIGGLVETAEVQN